MTGIGEIWFVGQVYGKDRQLDDVMVMLDEASIAGADLLLNAGPLHEGSIPKSDVNTLRKVGVYLNKQKSRSKWNYLGP